MTTPESYPIPPQGWVCFYCGDVFTTIGAASDHFGGDPGATAACKIKFGEELGLVMELRKAEEEAREWRSRALEAEQQVESLECTVATLVADIQSYKPFRNCRTIRDIFFVYDSMEGRALAAEEWAGIA